MKRRQAFAATTTRRGPITTLHLAGELDVATAPKLSPVLMQLAADGVTALVIDARHPDFIDSCGLRDLTTSAAVEDRRTATVASHPVELVIRLSGLESVLTLCNSIEDAISAVFPHPPRPPDLR